MTTLNVEGPNDYTDVTLVDVDVISFGGFGSSAIFSAGQFGAGISNTVHVISDSFVNHTITVVMTVPGTFSAAGWSYSTEWGFFFPEYTAIDGTSGDDTITGSVGRDIVTSNGGYDILEGGGGYDTLVLDRSADTASIFFSIFLSNVTSDWVASVTNVTFDDLLEATGFETVNLKTGSGADVINLHGLGQVVDAGGNNDIITLYNGSADGGAGKDELQVNGGFLTPQTTGISITFASGSDAAGWTGTISGGGNVDVDFQGMESFELWSEGNFDDVMRTKGGDDLFHLEGGGTDIVDGGAGYDWLEILQQSGAGVVAKVTAAGSDNEGVKGTVNAGPWNVTFDRINATLFDLGGANDSLELGNGVDLVTIRANGTDVVKTAGGRDSASFIWDSNTTATFGVAATGDGYNGTVSGSDGTSVAAFNVNDVTVITEGSTNDTVRMTMRNAVGDFQFFTDQGAGLKTLTLDYSFATTTLKGVRISNVGFAGGYIELYAANGAFINAAEFYNIDVTRITLGSGSDIINTGYGKDTIIGGAGNDRINSGIDNDVLNGGIGNDTLNGEAGVDTLAGGVNNDIYILSRVLDPTRNDTVIEGANAGTDTVRFTGTAAKQLYALGANVENLVLLGTFATWGNGNALGNTIVGNTGANVINGGLGKDILTGGLGSDRFVFNTAPSASNIDRITDFNVSADTIVLENAIFTKVLGPVGATIGPAQFWKSTTGLAHDGNDRIIYETDTGKVFYDSNGNAAGGAVQVAIIGVNLALTQLDFVIM